MAKRIVLFLVTNLLVLVTLSIVLYLLGFTGYLGPGGQLRYGPLLGFCFVWGMGGSFISLAISRWIAKRSTGAVVVDGRTGDPTLDWVHATVSRLAQQANLPMPEVAVYDSPEVNAFATGPTRKRSLVAVSTGLLRGMNRREVEGVLGHEICHVANGDMVTMGLLQGVVNTFVYFFATIIGHVVDRTLFRSGDDDRGGYGPAYYITQMIAQIVLSVLATMIVMWFSRWREFRADAGGAGLAGRGKMVGALRALQRAHEPQDLPGEFAAFGISGGIAEGFQKLFMSHPPLEERIAALQNQR